MAAVNFNIPPALYRKNMRRFLNRNTTFIKRIVRVEGGYKIMSIIGFYPPIVIREARRRDVYILIQRMLNTEFEMYFKKMKEQSAT